ncbi:MAG: ATP-binding protein [Clostridia bacterium]|nr:ATP-binding protein [Clostridia bacterium]
MIKRELYLSKLRSFYDSELIKVLVGIRRSGKSVILKQIIDELKEKGIKEEEIIYLNFENLDFAFIKNEMDLFKYVKDLIVSEKKYYLFFDEIQNVENFEKAINSFRSNMNVSIFITGSNGKLLSGELATHLSGRYVEFKVLPFTYFEMCELLKTKGEEITEDTFYNYLKFGGMPQRFSFNNEDEINIYLNDLYNSIILRDVVQRSKIKDINLLNNIIQYLLENIGQIFSGRSVIGYLKQDGRKVAAETLYNYLDYINSALLMSKVHRYDIRGKKVLSTLEKYYVADLGIRNIKKSDIEFKLGGSLENIVYNELIVRGYKVNIGKIDDGEVDFIAIKGNDKVYVQVAYILSSESVISREFGAYDNINDNYKKYVLSMDKVDMSRNGIRHINILDFLLRKKDI